MTSADDRATRDAADLVGGSALVFGAQGVDRFARLATQFVLTWGLGAAAFGVYTSATTIGLLLSALSQLGLHSAAVYFGARARAAGDDAAVKGVVFGSLALNLAAGLVVTGATLAAAWVLPSWFESSDVARGVLVAAPIALFRPIARTLVGFVNAAGDVRGTARATYVTLPVSMLACTALCVALGLGVQAAIVAHTLSFVFFMLDGAATTWRRYGRALGDRAVASKPSVRALLAYGVPMSIPDALFRTNLQLDILILTWWVSSVDVGHYRAAVSLAMLGAIPTAAVRTAFRPMVADLIARGEQARLGPLTDIASRGLLVVALPLFLGVALVPDVLLSVFGASFHAAAGALLWLMVGQIVGVAVAPASTVLAMGGYARLELRNGVIALVINLALDLLLVPSLGPVGAAIGSAVSVTVWAVMRAVQVWRAVGVSPLGARGLGLLVVGVGMGSASWWGFHDASAGVRVAVFAGEIVVFGLAALVFGRAPGDGPVWMDLARRVGRKLRRRR